MTYPPVAEGRDDPRGVAAPLISGDEREAQPEKADEEEELDLIR
jgi:hypothetical protein